MEKLQPTRTVTATRLITLTTTYETELTAQEFLSLRPIESLTTSLLGQQPAVNLESNRPGVAQRLRRRFQRIRSRRDRRPEP